jgi:hypothetical protein
MSALPLLSILGPSRIVAMGTSTLGEGNGMTVLTIRRRKVRLR